MERRTLRQDDPGLRAVERMVDEQGPSMAADVRQRGGTRVFQYQAACPFRAFVELRLGAEKLEFPAGPGRAQRGTPIHAALEEFRLEVHTHEALCTRADIRRWSGRPWPGR